MLSHFLVHVLPVALSSFLAGWSVRGARDAIKPKRQEFASNELADAINSGTLTTYEYLRARARAEGRI